MPELYCSKCHHSEPIGRSERISLLRRRGKLLRDKQPDPEIVEALFQAELPQLDCPQCGRSGMQERPDAEAALDDEQWGEARRCVGCGVPIHADRLEILPDTQQCTACAAAGRTGASDEREFCPRCGAELKLAQASGRGLARYGMRCSGCGFRA